MKTQLDLWPHPGVHLQPDKKMTEPRFWVRRFVIWSEPDVTLHDLRLRPGLNIVWSPDLSDGGPAIPVSSLGHGSGKTLFCRLLRYCLGEERFAKQAQQMKIQTAFKDGFVGAEVIVDGTCWSILRPLGIARRTKVAVDVELEDLVAGKVEEILEMDVFLAAVQTRILSDAVAALLPCHRKKATQAWVVALAWLSRDQESRFSSILDWRNVDSDSFSPVRDFNRTEILVSLRALLGALDQQEQTLQEKIDFLAMKKTQEEVQVGHREWAIEHSRRQLSEFFSLQLEQLQDGPLCVQEFHAAAIAGLARVAQVAPLQDLESPPRLRMQVERAQEKVEILQRDLAVIDEKINLTDALISQSRGALERDAVALDNADIPVCPICEVPIDRVLAEGCKLSHRLPDFEALKKRHDFEKTQLDNYKKDRQQLSELKKALELELPSARALVERARQARDAVELQQQTRHDDWLLAQRLLGEVNRLSDLYATQEKARTGISEIARSLEEKREQAGAVREQTTGQLQRLSELFDAIVRALVDERAMGQLKLDGKGLHVTIDMGGERTSAAVDTLKVLAFDLSAMCLSIEGNTHIPAFLVHDSPREADLGLSLYHRLFRFVHGLEKATAEIPLFQYIVTTTTRPPKELIQAPWLLLQLEGSPAEKRLLRRDFS